MKITIYWIINPASGVMNYYANKESMLVAAKTLNDLGYMDHYKMYELETKLDDETLLALLNEKFEHCMFYNYDKAKRVYLVSE
jgi:hypothetical protein